jgi:NADH dehydrogenase [ubiquinone] 1 alpha subcomplex assembly factor 1
MNPCRGHTRNPRPLVRKAAHNPRRSARSNGRGPPKTKAVGVVPVCKPLLDLLGVHNVSKIQRAVAAFDIDRTTLSPRLRFAALVFVPACLFYLGPSVVSPRAAATYAVFAFDGSTSEPAWVVINDGVMGGVSSSKVGVTKGVLRWSGRVRLENNGGFASMRSATLPKGTNAALATGSSIVVRVKGTATTFNITLQTPGQWYWAQVTPTADGWSSFTIPYARILPRTRFGEPVDGDAYAGQALSNIGVLISNGKAEAFRLDIDSIMIV